MSTRHAANVDIYIRCARGHRHNFDNAVIPNSRKAPWGTMLTERCNNCGTICESTFDLNGRKSTTRYIHEDQYRIFLDQYSEYTGSDWNVLYFKVLERNGLKSTVMGTARKKPAVGNVVSIKKKRTA